MTRPEAGRAPRLVALLLLGLLPPGCAVHPTHDRGTVSDAVLGRTGHALRPAPGTGPDLPDGVSLADGLSEDEAVAVALWKNPDLPHRLEARPGDRAPHLLARGSAPSRPGDI